MSYEIKFKNKKQSHILNKNHHTTFSTKKKKKNPHYKNYHTIYLIKKILKNDHSYFYIYVRILICD